MLKILSIGATDIGHVVFSVLVSTVSIAEGFNKSSGSAATNY